ncbi:MAG: Ig-like domain-containing protein [Chitinophagaceae bacterium]|nr:Ig-like domain-containing protein [Chitinophagaceae bacterium]
MAGEIRKALCLRTMWRQFVVFFIIPLGAVIWLILSGTGCANIIPPSGGPRDSLPPVLVKSSPADSAVSFSGNKIVLTFNEFVEVQNPRQAVIISPNPSQFPEITYRLNTVTIRFREPPEKPATYVIDFGDAIRDFTEGNILKNFSFVFSTGNYIDSLELKGKVILAETGKPDSTLIVMLHVNPDDSAVVKEKPRYVTKVDANGNFVFRNLPARPFYLYALKDEGGTRRYFSERQLFAFADKSVIPSAKPESVMLYAYAATPSAPARQTLAFSSILGRAGGGEKRLKFQTNLVGDRQDLLQDFILTFETPIKRFDSSRLLFFSDSTFLPVKNYQFRKDSAGKSLRIIHSWKENTLYHIILDREFAEDSLGRKLLKTDTLTFTTKKISDYGSLLLKLNKDKLPAQAVLILSKDGMIQKSYPIKGLEINEPLFPPGEYELLILQDKNENGRWDPGEFFGKRKQPEVVTPLGKKITVKPGMKHEYEVAL